MTVLNQADNTPMKIMFCTAICPLGPTNFTLRYQDHTNVEGFQSSQNSVSSESIYIKKRTLGSRELIDIVKCKAKAQNNQGQCTHQSAVAADAPLAI
jgi:hypothetical protein